MGCHVLQVAHNIVARHPPSALFDLKPDKLARLKGVGRAKAGVLLAACELARRGLRLGLGVLPVVSSPTDTLGLWTEIKDQRRNHFSTVIFSIRRQLRIFDAKKIVPPKRKRSNKLKTGKLRNSAVLLMEIKLPPA